MDDVHFYESGKDAIAREICKYKYGTRAARQSILCIRHRARQLHNAVALPSFPIDLSYFL